MKCFSIDLTTLQIASLTKIHRNTVSFILQQTRKRISEYCESESYFDKGEIEMDESYFGARRVRALRGRGARGKTIVFGLCNILITEFLKSCQTHNGDEC